MKNIKPLSVLRTGGNRKGIELKQEEVQLLKELAIHRTLDSSDMYTFINALKFRKKRSFTSRLATLTEKGVLLRYKEVFGLNGGLYRFRYRLGKKGFQILLNEGHISEKKAEQIYQQILAMKTPKLHNQSVAFIVNTCRVHMIERGYFDHEHFRGTDDVSIMQEDVKSMIIPDWVFRRGKRSIFLEVDTGAQRSHMITSKIERYIRRAKENHNDEHIVMFSVVDQSVDVAGVLEKISQDRSKRISGLKGVMPPFQTLPSNLSIYVAGADRTPEIVFRLLTEQFPASAHTRNVDIVSWYFRLFNISNFTHGITQLTKSQIYGRDMDKQLEAEEILSLMNELRHSKKVALLYGEEGSVKTYQQVAAHYNRTKGHVSNGERLDDIWVIYSTLEEVQEELFGEHWETVWLHYQNGVTEEKIMPFYRIVSAFKKELMTYS